MVTLVFSALALFNYRIGVVLLVLIMPIANTSLFPHELFGVTGLNPFNLLLFLTLLSYLLPRFLQRETYTLIPRLFLRPVFIACAGGGPDRHNPRGQIPLSLDISEAVNFDNAAGYFRDMVIRPLFTLIVAYLIAAAVRDSKITRALSGLGAFLGDHDCHHGDRHSSMAGIWDFCAGK